VSARGVIKNGRPTSVFGKEILWNYTRRRLQLVLDFFKLLSKQAWLTFLEPVASWFVMRFSLSVRVGGGVSTHDSRLDDGPSLRLVLVLVLRFLTSRTRPVLYECCWCYTYTRAFQRYRYFQRQIFRMTSRLNSFKINKMQTHEVKAVCVKPCEKIKKDTFSFTFSFFNLF
jgi:hypothetical protein